MHIKIVAVILCAALLTALLLVGGCGKNSNTPKTTDVVATDSNPICLQNYRLAREYSSVGRHELAREHYLLAYATADTPFLRDALAKELESIDRIIQSLR